MPSTSDKGFCASQEKAELEEALMAIPLPAGPQAISRVAKVRCHTTIQARKSQKVKQEVEKPKVQKSTMKQKVEKPKVQKATMKQKMEKPKVQKPTSEVSSLREQPPIHFKSSICRSH